MQYKFNENIVLRTPFKPFKSTYTSEELKAHFQQKEVQEALFLSSPNLLNEFKKWQKGEITDPKEEKKLLNSLLKYAIRMHTRCTPFCLFANNCANSFLTVSFVLFCLIVITILKKN